MTRECSRWNWDLLESLLADCEPQKLAKEFYRYNIIDQKCQENICKLDFDNLESEIALRYLLVHVTTRIDKSEASERLKKCLREKCYNQYVLYCIHTETNNPELSIGDYIVTTKDETLLVTLLYDVAPKSEVLGVALGLSTTTRYDCLKGDSCVTSLAKIVHAWIMYTKAPRLQILIDALKSQTVGFTNTSKVVEEEFTKNHSLSFKNKELCQISPFENISVKVSEGKSTLIEACKSFDNKLKCQWLKDDIIIQNGRDYFNSDSGILYVHEADLLHQGHYECRILDSEGNVFAVREHVNLTVTLSPERLDLIHRYSFMPDIPINHWPPVGSKKYINLAIVSNWGQCSPSYQYTVQGDMDDIYKTKENVLYESVFEKFESKSVMLIEGRPGSGKTTLVHKVCKEWAEVGNVLKHTQLVFFISLRMLSVKEKNLSDVLSKLFYTDIAEKSKLDSIVDELVKRNGAKACFILDGLDEYDLDSKKDTVIFRLIYKQFLSDSMVIITSRPVATSKLKVNLHSLKRIEVLGFSESEIYQYVKSYTFRNPETPSKLISYLLSRRKVLQMCYLPVHTAMICYLYSKLGDQIPNTESAIYAKFTLYTILRHKYRDNDDLDITSPDQLNGEDKILFEVICKRAFELTASAKQIILNSDLPKGIEPHMLGIVTLDKTAELYGMKNIYAYHHLTFQEYLAAWYVYLIKFLRNAEEQIELIKLHSHKPHMKMVWKFYCGITDIANNISHFELIISSFSSDSLYAVQCAFESQQKAPCNSVICVSRGIMSFRDRLLTEQDMMAFSFTIKNASILATQLDFEKCLFLAVPSLNHKIFQKINSISFKNHRGDQSKVFNYIIQNARNLKILDLTNSPYDVHELTQNIKLNNLNTIKASIIRNEFSGYTLLSQNELQLLKFHSSCLQCVYINLFPDREYGHDEYEFYDMNRIKAKLQYNVCATFGFHVFFRREIPEVCLFNANVYPLDIKTIEPEHFIKCTHLSLINCNVDDKALEKLSNGLKYSLNLSGLNLGFNRITDIGAQKLALTLKRHRSLFYLEFLHNSIGDEGALQLLESLRGCKKLRKFDIQCNIITYSGVQKIYFIVKKIYQNLDLKLWNKDLNFQSLDLYICKNTLDLQSCYLGMMPQYLPGMLSKNLHVLSLRNNWLFMVEFLKMIPHLLMCINLQELILSYNLFCSNLPCDYDPYFNKYFRKLILHCPNISLLDMSKDSLHHLSFNFNIVGLSRLANLKHLDFSGNTGLFTFEQAQEIGKCKNLRTLVVNKCNLNLPIVVEMISKCKKLQRIGLEMSYISDSLELVLDCLFSLPELRILEIGFCHISHKVSKIKSIYAKPIVLLQDLDIRANDLDVRDFAFLSTFQWNNLQFLNIRSNNIDCSDIELFVQALKYFITHLNKLDISSNKISDEGLLAVQVSLFTTNTINDPSHKCLQTLIISDNCISDSSIPFFSLLSSNLTSLNITDSRFSQNGIQYLQDCCSKLEEFQHKGQKPV